jgi:hypothetical protein
LPFPPAEHRLVGTARRALENVVLWRIHHQRQRGESVGDHVDPQQVQRQQRERPSGHRRSEHHRQFGGIASQQVDERLADVVEDAAAFTHGGNDAGEVVVGKHHVRGLTRHFGARAAHGDADVRFAQRRRIVDHVPCHRDNGVPRLPRSDDAELVLRCCTGADDLFACGRVRDDAEFGSDSVRGDRVVAGDHDCGDASGTRRPHRLDHAWTRRIRDPNQPNKRRRARCIGSRDRDRQYAKATSGHARVFGGCALDPVNAER